VQRALLVSTIFCLTFFGFGKTEIPQVDLLHQKARSLAQQGDYIQSLKYLNRALGYLTQSPHSHPKRIAIESEIRIIKGKSLVARYKERRKQGGPQNPSSQLSTDRESTDLKIEEYFGKILAREIWNPIQIDDSNEYLGFGRRITVLPKSGIELSVKNTALKIRAVEAASFSTRKPYEFDFHTGSYCINSTGKNDSLNLISPLSNVELSSTMPFAFMCGVTTNGGLKIICLLGKIKLRKNGDSQDLVPGQLIFSLPDGFSRKMDVELSTLMITSNLLTSFKKPPTFFKKLRQQSMLQALRTRNRFRTVVGDVKGRENFELKVLQEK
jgi:hypothetical protein